MAKKTDHDNISILKTENTRLKKAIEELSILNEIATAINSMVSLDDVVNKIVRQCVKHLRVEQALVSLLETTPDPKALKTVVRSSDSKADGIPFRLDNHLTGWMLHHRKALIINDLKNDERFKGYSEDFPIRSLLSVPLILNNRMIGVLSVFNKSNDETFTADHQRILSIIATQSAQVIENARLLKEEHELRQIREEMRLANEIQKTLLPSEAPKVAGYDIAGVSVPAKDVGGDYFDFFHVDDKKLAFCLGDVTGKGMPAALLMSNLQAIIRGQAIAHSDSARQCMATANYVLFQNTSSNKFATVFYGILDFERHVLTYCNAGHDRPYYKVPGRSFRELERGGVVLGFMPKMEYEQETIAFEPGAKLIVFSDGVTEAMNELSEEFGIERLKKLIDEYDDLSAGEFIDIVIESIQTHSQGIAQSDDITIMVIRRL